MSSLKIFLEEALSSLKHWRDFGSLHIVLGNEACDLDSTICSLAYGYYLSKKLNTKKNTNTAVFPVVNVPSEEFSIRTEHCSLLKEINIDIKNLIYRSDIDIDGMISEKKDSIKTYLVDHHVLSEKDKVLKETVCNVFDHRPVDKTSNWPTNTKLRIEQVGSCASLVTDEMLKEEGVLPKDLAYLLYCTIVFDTLAVLPENKKAKPLDIEIAKKLEDKFGFTEPRLDVFHKIVNLHADISNLTPDQLLIRDLKFVKNIPIPALPMLVESFSKLPGVEKSLKGIAAKKTADFLVLIGIEAKPEVRRDIGVFFNNDDSEIKKNLLGVLKSHEEFKFEEVSCGLPNFIVFRQNNIEQTRKQVIPIIKSFLDKNNG